MPEIDFISPRLTGDRFADHSIPLEMLKDMSVLQDMIIDAAKWKFIQDNPDRVRSPRGFTKGISLRLADIEEGSAIPKIALAIAATASPQAQEEYLPYYTSARDAVISAISSAESDESANYGLPPAILSYFDRLGRSLRPGEAMEFARTGDRAAARLTHGVRKRLIDASNVDSYTEEIYMLGSIPEIDQDKRSFTLMDVDGRRYVGPIEPAHEDAIQEAFQNYRSSKQKVVIECIAVYTRNGRLDRIGSVEAITILDPRDIGARLQEIAALKPGWCDGEGGRFDVGELRAVWDLLHETYPDELSLPYIYPKPNGELLFEWDTGVGDLSLEYDVSAKRGYLHLMADDEENDRESEHELVDRDSWLELFALVSELLGN